MGKGLRWVLALVGFAAGAAGVLAYGLARRRRCLARPSPALDALLPEYQFSRLHAGRIAATPRQVMKALNEVTLRDMPLARLLLRVRQLTLRLAGRTTDALSGLDRPLRNMMAQTPLLEQAGREVVFGTIGKLYHVKDQGPTAFADSREFTHFDQDGYHKLALSYRVVAEEGGGGTLFVQEQRIQALGDAALEKFGRYWILLRPGSAWRMRLIHRAVKRRATQATRTISLVQAPQG